MVCPVHSCHVNVVSDCYDSASFCVRYSRSTCIVLVPFLEVCVGVPMCMYVCACARICVCVPTNVPLQDAVERLHFFGSFSGVKLL